MTREISSFLLMSYCYVVRDGAFNSTRFLHRSVPQIHSDLATVFDFTVSSASASCHKLCASIDYSTDHGLNPRPDHQKPNIRPLKDTHQDRTLLCDRPDSGKDVAKDPISGKDCPHLREGRSARHQLIVFSGTLGMKAGQKLLLRNRTRRELDARR